MTFQIDAMDTAEAAEFLGVSVNTLARYRHRGSGPTFFRVGRSVFYEQWALDGWKDHVADMGRGRGD